MVGSFEDQALSDLTALKNVPGWVVGRQVERPVVVPGSEQGGTVAFKVECVW